MSGTPAGGQEHRRDADRAMLGPPPGTPAWLLSMVWLVQSLGLPTALLLWFVLRADEALRSLLAAQAEQLRLLEQLVRALGRLP